MSKMVRFVLDGKVYEQPFTPDRADTSGRGNPMPLTLNDHTDAMWFAYPAQPPLYEPNSSDDMSRYQFDLTRDRRMRSIEPQTISMDDIRRVLDEREESDD